MLGSQGEYAEAERLYEQAQVIREEVLGSEHPDVAASLNSRVGLLRAQVSAIQFFCDISCGQKE